MDTEPIWYKYATFDDAGFVNGVEENAPEDIKTAYADYVIETEIAEKNGKRIAR